MKIDAAIFDIGNVLLPFDYMKAANRLVEKNRLPHLPDREKIVKAKEQYELGRIDRAEFLNRVRPEFQDAGEESEFVRIWQEIFEPNEALYALVEVLAAKGIPLYLLSNISDIHHEYIVEEYPIFSRFQDGIFSYKAGLLKPDPEIFQVAIKHLKVDPARTLYLDDMPENVAAAKAAGFIAIEYSAERHAEIEPQVLELIKSME
jgi:epoxide hydrolase-like predicted phosphatase